MPGYIQKIQLQNYRNLSVFEAEFGETISVVIGDNGIGKTNLLESISLLSPGKGLRNGASEDICKYGESNWSICANVATALGPAKFDINYSKDTHKKIIEFNGSKIAGSEFSNFINIIWLTPQMDGLFLGSSGDRRKFMDRMVFSRVSDHAKLVSKYEHHQKERMKLLETHRNNEWLDVIEKEMAVLSVTITENRLNTISKLNENISEISSSFPHARLELSSHVIESLELSNPAEDIAHRFAASRNHDVASGRTNFGPHRADFKTFYTETGSAAEHCSTGQQKALLISIIIAQQISNKEKPPILLLDEIFVHLDEKRREALAKFLLQNKFQSIITSTEKEITQLLIEPRVVNIKSF